MGSFSDSVSLTTTGAATEITGTLKIPVGAKIIEIALSGLDTDGLPQQVRIEYSGIKTPQKYSTGMVGIGAVAAGLDAPIVKIPVDIDIASSDVTIGLIATAAGTWLATLKYFLA